MEAGLHQGSVLSPLLFTTVMDRLTDEVRRESPWTVMFADDIVKCSESREQLEGKPQRWQGRTLVSDRGGAEWKAEVTGRGDAESGGGFKCSESTVQSNGMCSRAAVERVPAGWNGRTDRVSGGVGDKRIEAKV